MAEHTDIQDYQRFKLAFQAGAEQVIIYKKELNDINVFLCLMVTQEII